METVVEMALLPLDGLAPGVAASYGAGEGTAGCSTECSGLSSLAESKSSTGLSKTQLEALPPGSLPSSESLLELPDLSCLQPCFPHQLVSLLRA